MLLCLNDKILWHCEKQLFKYDLEQLSINNRCVRVINKYRENTS